MSVFYSFSLLRLCSEMFKNDTYQVLNINRFHYINILLILYKGLNIVPCFQNWNIQKYIGNICHALHHPLAKFHFDTCKYSEQIIKDVTPDMLCLWWCCTFWNLRIQNLEDKMLFFLHIKKLVHYTLGVKLSQK